MLRPLGAYHQYHRHRFVLLMVVALSFLILMVAFPKLLAVDMGRSPRETRAFKPHPPYRVFQPSFQQWTQKCMVAFPKLLPVATARRLRGSRSFKPLPPHLVFWRSFQPEEDKRTEQPRGTRTIKLGQLWPLSKVLVLHHRNSVWILTTIWRPCFGRNVSG